MTALSSLTAPSFPTITTMDMFNARRNCPVVRAMTSGPKQTGPNPLQTHLSAGLIGLSIGAVINKVRQNARKRAMREPCDTQYMAEQTRLTAQEEALFDQVTDEKIRKFNGDTLKSHPISLEGESCLGQNERQTTTSKTLTQASSSELAYEAASRLGNSIWALGQQSASLASQVIWAVGQNIYNSACQTPAMVSEYLFPKPQQDEATAPIPTPSTAHTPLVTLPAPRGILDSHITIGQPLPLVNIETDGFIKTDGQDYTFAPWTSASLPVGFPKLVAMLPAKPNKKAELQSLGDAIEARGFATGECDSFTIINVADLPAQTGLAGGLGSLATGFRNMVKPGIKGSVVHNAAMAEIIKGAKQKPKMAIIADQTGETKQVFGLQPDTCYTFVLDENNNVVSALDGKVSEEEHTQILNWCQEKVDTIKGSIAVPQSQTQSQTQTQTQSQSQTQPEARTPEHVLEQASEQTARRRTWKRLWL